MRWLLIGLLVSLGALLLAAAAAARHVLMQRKALRSVPAKTSHADEADVETDS
jgi:gamma-glutamylcysteine synthetase